MRTLFYILVVVSLALAAMRAGGVTSIAFQASAHLVVGLCIGVAVGEKRWRFAWLAIALTVVEVAAFAIGISHHS